MLVWVPQSLQHDTFCSSCEAGLGGTTLYFHSGFFVARAMGTCAPVSIGFLVSQSLTSPPLLKESCPWLVWHCITKPWASSSHPPPPSKTQRRVQSILCTPGLQKFLSAEIALIVQVTFRKISKKSVLGAQVDGLSFHLLGCHLQSHPSCLF